MKRWKCAMVVLTAAVLARFGAAQSNESALQRQLDEMKARLQSHETELQAIKAENAELKAKVGEVAPDPLETQINRLQDCGHPGATIRSGASALGLGGEFRFRRWSGRGENTILFKEGVPQNLQEENDGYWNDARVRLNFRYDFGCDATAFAELQSHWAFGDDPTGPIDDWDGNDVDGNVGMYQAWLEVRDMFGRKELSSRLGRQEIVLGNQFQFGNADWYNGVVFDGGRVDWTGRCWNLTLLTLKLSSLDGDRNQVSSFQSPHDDDELVGAYFALHPSKRLAIDAYWFYVNGHGGASGQGSVNSGANAGVDGILDFLYPGAQAYWNTFGARIGGSFNVFCGLDYNAEVAYQTGTVHDFGGSDPDVDAIAAEAEVGLTFSKRSRFRVFARALFAEGPGDDDVGYLTLFPNRHSYSGFRARYGLADLIPMTNVETVQLGFHFDPFCDWTFGATALWARAEEQLRAGDADYGAELDLWGEWRWSKQITFTGGVALVQPGDQGEFSWGLTDELQVMGYLEARLVF
jgi:Alginate export